MSDTDQTDAGAAREPSEDEQVLVAEDVVSGYLPGIDILHGTDLELRKGELVGIIGPNGAGKSTLVKTLFGLVPVRSGRVLFRGQDVSNKPAHELVEMGIGYVPQIANVFATLTVEENLQMGAYLDPGVFEERYAFVTDLFPLLDDRRKQRAGSLSGGERQMVAMARAMMLEPQVLLLDEPSAGLSPANQDEAFARIGEINQAGVSIIMVEQNARRCLQICDRGYVMDQGENAHTGTGRELLNDPKVIDLYLGTLAKVD